MILFTKKIKLILTLALLCYPVATFAAMSSTNYYIYADSVGVNGGNYSSSTSFGLQDTIGGSPAGISASSTYTARGGFQAMDQGSLSLDISSESVNLGTLASNQVSTASTNLTVSSDASTGYTLSVGSVSGTMIQAVADGSVTAGHEEYGVAAAGAHSQISGDVAVVGSLIIASDSSPVLNDTTALTFKASISSGSVGGTYSQTVVFTASANF